jgi:hypothetical protein
MSDDAYSIAAKLTRELIDARAELARLREQCAIHERSIATWGTAMGRVCEALGRRGDGHADTLAERCVDELARLREENAWLCERLTAVAGRCVSISDRLAAAERVIEAARVRHHGSCQRTGDNTACLRCELKTRLAAYDATRTPEER